MPENPPTHDPPIRVFLVDDHRATLWGLEQLIAGADGMRLIGTATSPAELLAAPANAEADVIVLDLDFGGQDCIAALSGELREHVARVLLLTGTRDEDAHRRAVLAGARGVVRKEEPVEVLLRAIRKVHAGEVWINRSLLGSVMNALIGARAPADAGSARIAALTPKEHEVIATVLRHRGAKSLVLADALGISEHTLRNHLTVIYSKLGVRGRLELYLFASEHGLGNAG